MWEQLDDAMIDSKMKKNKGELEKAVLKFWKIVLGVTLFFLIFYFSLLKDLPSPTKLSSLSSSKSTQIFDRNDKLLYSIYAKKNQTFIPLSQIPKSVQKATIAIEDKDFYRHGAIDPRAITRALFAIVFHQNLQGGSTLTQQLVKNSLLTPERTLPRKIKEIMLSFVAEIIYPKDKILEMYLNQIPYGGTAWGVEAASEVYFGKHAKELSLAESALLSGLPEAPTAFSPFGAHPELAKKRQEDVLKKMANQGLITKNEMEKAVKEPLHFQKFASNIKAPHFVLYVKDLLIKKYGAEIVEEGGFRVKTSLDLKVQTFAEDVVATEVAKLKGYRVSNGAALVTNPKTGEILAMIGSKDYFDATIDGNVNITTSLRQPGSAIKPINYATGLIHGYTGATPFVDKETCFSNPGHPPYCPVNYDGKFHGVLQMRNALGNSINIPAVKMLKLNGVEAMIATASAMGITSFGDPSRYGLSLTLGGGEVTMLDMARAFGVFANQGYRIDLHPILKVTDNQGKVLEEYNPLPSPIFGKKVLPQGVAFIISHILLDNNAREIEFGLNSELKIGNLPVSVKTGTTNDFRDNWTIGYTPSVLVAVWVGNNDNTPMGGLVSGITGAAPIWNRITSNLLKEKKPEWPQQPDDIVGANICNISGLLPPPEGTPNRCQTRFEYFLKGTVPKNTDPGRQKVWIDKSTNDLAKEGQTDNVEEKEEIVVTDPTGDRYCLTCPHPSLSPTLTP